MEDRLVYLSLGEGRHVPEVRFSVLTALQHHGVADRPWTTQVWTDHPEHFASLPVEVKVIDPETRASWIGPHGYVYRAKIQTLIAALRDPGAERVALIDGDTYFKRSPSLVFTRIAPRRAVMHLKEGRMQPHGRAGMQHVLDQALPRDTTGAPVTMTRDEPQYNSGVVGLHATDEALAHDALAISDHFIEHGFAQFLHTAEMVGLSASLHRGVEHLAEAHDVVAHYWLDDHGGDFVPELQRMWSAGAPDHEVLQRMWGRRPRPGLKERAKHLVKRSMFKVGLDL